MKIAVIGGGLTGLTAAYELVKAGHNLTLFEKEKELGGLAGGFKEKNWDWHLEKSYHHWFTNDNAVIGLAKELGLTSKLIIKRPITANFWHGKAYPFDSPTNLLRYPGLTGIAKLRTAFFAAFCKINPFWRPLENITAERFAKAIGGNVAWENLWEPLMVSKFGDYADKVAASWLWARLKKRTPSLGYIEGGFQTLVTSMSQAIKQNGGTINVDAQVQRIKTIKDSHSRESGNPIFILNWTLGSSPGMTQTQTFDRVLLTIPTPVATKLFPQLTTYNPQLTSIPHLHAQTLILKTKEPILDKVYWLSILDREFPFLAVVAHTNFMDSEHYGGHHLTYFGNYLPDNHPFLQMDALRLYKIFKPFIIKINPNFRQQCNNVTMQQLHLFIGFDAQPVHLLHYPKLAPPLKTGVPNLYLANLDSIYPWDRGTNYAVELGQKAAHLINE